MAARPLLRGRVPARIWRSAFDQHSDGGDPDRDPPLAVARRRVSKLTITGDFAPGLDITYVLSPPDRLYQYPWPTSTARASLAFRDRPPITSTVSDNAVLRTRSRSAR
ncbi:hypothetical protein GCM10022225_69740 [Plantactinospora mayteni]|uniref:Uncharacterized protein n=1 Tax=Plantactinospora mayteni TaxID=566021 RepID=A0ABQ4EVZ8_9ACTN|nr:hypothetical protein Pma05_54060 [Plantactinospora mayteni]